MIKDLNIELDSDYCYEAELSNRHEILEAICQVLGFMEECEIQEYSDVSETISAGLHRCDLEMAATICEMLGIKNIEKDAALEVIEIWRSDSNRKPLSIEEFSQCCKDSQAANHPNQ